jgi:hypothetical protein
MKENKHYLHKDLIKELWHPIRISKHLDAGFEVETYLE